MATKKDTILTPDSTNTLTNKGIDADNNLIQNLEVGNLKSTAVSTAIPSSGAVDTKLTTEKAVKDGLDTKQGDIITGVSGTGGQALCRNSANDALEFRDVATGAIVSAWQTTPDDSHYPSEKLAKDTIDTKQDTITYSPTAPASPKDGDLWMNTDSASDLMDILNALFPIGSYSFGTHPSIGTWQEVTGDRAIWLKSGTADGTEIEQALPNVKGNICGIAYDAYFSQGVTTKPFYRNGTQSKPNVSTTSNADATTFSMDLSKANSIYKDGANVQPNAYVMTVYKRTA